MRYLEKIQPSYFDLLTPLTRWKILNVKTLKEDANYLGSASGFYKIIAKLEKSLLIDSFINSWSNEKFVYLLPNGIRALGENETSLNLNRDLRFHDSLVAKVARFFDEYEFINDVCLDFQIRDRFPLLERVPDILIDGDLDGAFRMAIEVELTQKNQTRVKEIFRTYSDSKVINNVIYITDKPSLLKTYRRYLNELGEQVQREKFLFLLEEDLAKTKISLELSKVYLNGKETDLKSIFKS